MPYKVQRDRFQPSNKQLWQTNNSTNLEELIRRI